VPSQEDVSAYLNYSRPTYIAIEKGERPAKAEEIVKLAAYFGRKVSELVRPGEPVIDFQPHLRAATEKIKAEDQRELLAAIGDLQRLASDYRELEQMVNAPLRYNYRIKVGCSPGTGKMKIAGGVEGSMKESIQRAYAYMMGQKVKVGIGRQIDTTDFHVEAIDLLSNHVPCEAGMALVVAVYRKGGRPALRSLRSWRRGPRCAAGSRCRVRVRPGVVLPVARADIARVLAALASSPGIELADRTIHLDAPLHQNPGAFRRLHDRCCGCFAFVARDNT
jgi:transcriptional regulator with XRE-family HTH domain